MILRKATIVTPEGNAMSQEVANEGEAFRFFFEHLKTATGENAVNHGMLSSRPATYVTAWLHVRLGYKLEYLEVPV